MGSSWKELHKEEIEAAGLGASRKFRAYRKTLEMDLGCYDEGHGVEMT